MWIRIKIKRKDGNENNGMKDEIKWNENGDRNKNRDKDKNTNLNRKGHYLSCSEVAHGCGGKRCQEYISQPTNIRGL